MYIDVLQKITVDVYNCVVKYGLLLLWRKNISYKCLETKWSRNCFILRGMKWVGNTVY